MTLDHEAKKASASTDGRNHHCGTQGSAMGASPLESDNGTFSDRSEACPVCPDTQPADCCLHKDGGNGSGGSMASMVGRSTAKEMAKMIRRMNADDIFSQARDICRERGKVYGHPKEDFDKIAHIWEVIFQVPVNPEQVALAMIGVKIARICQNESFYHADSVLDILGYANCLEEVANHVPPKDEEDLF